MKKLKSANASKTRSGAPGEERGRGWTTGTPFYEFGD